MARSLEDIASDIALIKSDIKDLEQRITEKESERRELFAACSKLVVEFNDCLKDLYPAAMKS